jgi:tetratricopeptide (TPR) repeat protein
MSAYHYLPSLVLAAMLGRWIEAGLRAGEGGGRARALASLLVCILALYAQTLRGVTTEYVRIQEPTLRLVERVRAILAKDPGARVYVDHHLPQAPLNNSQFTDEIHTFHAFSLMFGERIMPVRSLATVIARASGEAPASRETAAQDARSLLQQAALFDWHGEHADAERYKRLAADLTPAGVTAAEELQKGISLHQQGRLDEAIARTLAAAALDPKLAQARFNLGVYFSEKGLLDEAIAHTRAALALDPGSVGAHFNLGYFLHTRGRLDEAEREYREALRLDPNAANARLNLGILLRSQGRAGLD